VATIQQLQVKWIIPKFNHKGAKDANGIVS